MRYLCKDTNSITSLSGSVLTGSMLKILYNLKSIINYLVAFLSFNIDYRTNTTVVMFELAVIQAISIHLLWCT